jgi:hypothetical protein
LLFYSYIEDLQENNRKQMEESPTREFSSPFVTPQKRTNFSEHIPQKIISGYKDNHTVQPEGKNKST